MQVVLCMELHFEGTVVPDIVKLISFDISGSFTFDGNYYVNSPEDPYRFYKHSLPMTSIMSVNDYSFLVEIYRRVPEEFSPILRQTVHFRILEVL